MNNFELEVTDDLQASFMARITEFAGSHPGPSSLFVTGGSQAHLCYPALASALSDSRSPLGRYEIFLGDERVVPLTSESSNTALIDGLIGSAYRASELRQIYSPTRTTEVDLAELMAASDPVPTHISDAQSAALRGLTNGFAQALRAAPAARLVHLGLGPDGHVASNFPNGIDFGIRTPEAATSLDVTGLNRFWRLTISMDFINSSSLVLLSVSGSEKGEVLRRVLTNPDSFPAGNINAPNFAIVVDRQASLAL